MRTPIAALVWEIWRPKRWWFGLSAGITLFGCLLHVLLPDSLHSTPAERDRLLVINGFLLTGALLLIFGALNYTGFNPQKEWTGFPYHLFTLPVSSVVLVTVPLTLGVAAVEATFLIWARVVFTFHAHMSPQWLAVLIGAYMIFYQTVLWVLAAFQTLRIITMALVGTSFVAVAFLPAFGEYISSSWFSERILIPLMALLAMVAFFIGWWGVARQRSGGGRRQKFLRRWMDSLLDLLPGRDRDFRSPSAAQFWFEWRRSGQLLPICVAAILIAVILPLSWHLRDESDASLWILGWTLATPMLLAVPIGKGFSKPDFWGDLTIPSFLATRPLATGEWIVIKMKVAALSAMVSWFLVLVFLWAWLPLWANLESLSRIRLILWMLHDHRALPQYALAALALFGGSLVTWKCLVNGLWIGLSGSRKLFVGSGVAYACAGLAGMISLAVLFNDETGFQQRVSSDPDQWVAVVIWIVALAVVAKFWLAARAWRTIRPRRVGRYALAWGVATLSLLGGAILISVDGTLGALLMAVLDFPPVDGVRLASLLILCLLLVIPLARLGLAPASFTRNRHG